MENERETIVVDKEETKIKQPCLYYCVFINDDYTSADFVVHVLIKNFGMSVATAVDVMLDVHERGKGIAGIYTKDVAETKATLTMQEAQVNEFPLIVVVEPTE
jgi:ATP-dependent Clp protease adaptor protein ClpS